MSPSTSTALKGIEPPPLNSDLSKPLIIIHVMHKIIMWNIRCFWFRH